MDLSRLKFRPSLVPTLFTVPAVLVMLGLCIWQVQRLQEKTQMIAEREARFSAEPIALPAEGTEIAPLEFRQISVAGTFRHDRELYLGARSRNGNVGYHIVTPLELAGGGAIFVDRGWVPVERKLPERRAEGQIEGETKVDGLIRLPQQRAWMQPENEPAKNLWLFLDLPAMAKAVEMPAGMRTDFYIEAGPAENPGGYPIGGQAKVNLPNDHLQYAITWALLAAALIVVYVVYHLKLERDRRS